MADPVSIITGVYGVVAAGLKLSVGLYSILDKYDSALDPIENIASNLNFLALVLEELGNILNVPADQSMASDRLVESLKQIMEKCRMLFKEINKMIFRANGAKTSKIGQRIEWFFREGKVTNVKATLDSLKSTLGLMLQTLKLKNARGDGIEREREILKNLLNTQQHSLRRLRRVENMIDKKIPPQAQNDSTTPPVKDSLLTSTILSQAMPPKPIPKPPPSLYDQSETAMPENPGAAIGVFAPAYNEESDYVQLLLTRWTRPSESPKPDKETIGEKYASGTADVYGRPVTPINRVPGNDAIPEVGLSVAQRLEFIKLDYRRCLDKRINDLKLKGHRADANLELRLASLEKASEEQREALNVNHEADLSKLEDQLLAREFKEDAVRSIKLELERSQRELEARAQHQQSSETMQPGFAHTDRLQRRLETEMGELAVIKEALAEAKRKIKVDFECKVEELERTSKIEKEKATNENMDEMLQGTKDLNKLEGMLTTSSGDFTELRDQWIALMKRIGWVFISETVEKGASIEFQDVQRESSPKLDWLDEGVEDGDDDEFVGEAEESGPHGQTPPTLEKEAEQGASGNYSNRIPPPEDRKVNSGQSGENYGGLPAINCRRQAWKPPQPFNSAFNTLAYMFNLNLEFLWFKASRDEYRFFRGARPEPFYTIELVPADLRTFQTSRVEWTIIQKTWANSKALIAAGYAYREDSDGQVWIKEDLKWVEVQQLFHMSCSFLDSMMTVSSRKVLAKRSEENGENLPNSAVRSGVLARLRKAKEFDQHFEFHGVFFRPAEG